MGQDKEARGGRGQEEEYGDVYELGKGLYRRNAAPNFSASYKRDIRCVLSQSHDIVTNAE